MRHHLIDREYAAPPDDLPVSREPADRLPEEEAASLPAPAEEYPAPAPELILPGTYVSEEGGKRAKDSLRPLLLAGAVLLILYLCGLLPGLFHRVTPGPDTPSEASVTPGPAVTEPDPTKPQSSEPGSEPVPGTGEAPPAVYTDIPGEEYGPQIYINYAVLDGTTLRYSYFVLTWLRGELCEVSADQRAVVKGGSAEYCPEQNPDSWYGSRSMPEYTLETGGEDTLQLVITGTYRDGGETKLIRAVKDVSPLPPMPHISADFSETDGGIYFKAVVTPAEGDDHEYRLVPQPANFSFVLYDRQGEYLGGGSIHEDDVPESSDGFTFIYDGPADRHFPDTAAEYSVMMLLIDESTGYPYSVETERKPIVRQTYETPSCRITAYAFWSEMHGDVLFEDMSSVKEVLLEVWDPNTEYMDSRTDITDEAVSELRYDIPPFYTDGIYEANPDYYSQPGVDFPMQVEYRVVITYDWEDGERTVTYAAQTMQESGYFAKYLPDSEAQYSPEYAGMILISAEPTETVRFTKIVLDDPDQVTGPGIVSIRVEIDGVPVPAADITISEHEYETYFGSSNEPVLARFCEALIKRPAGITEADGKTAVVYVTHFLVSENEAHTAVVEVPIAPFDP